MKKKQFKAESQRLLKLMIHSIYTNKEIFLRELISNASDATDKRYYLNIQGGGEALNREDLPITITPSKENRTLTIEDNGFGMTGKEMEKNLGTIAQSGSLEFKESLEENDETDIIGQFGVGFYSAFMVADQIDVYSKTLDMVGNHWSSSGIEGYTIEEFDRKEVGTKIVLTLKPDSEEEDYSRFLEEYTLRQLIKKHSDYIRYPIEMEVSKSRPKEGGEEGETESYSETEIINTMTPIWKKAKNEVSDEDYNQFYKSKFMDYTNPLKTIYTSTEGTATYNALLFVPANAPMNYHSKDYKKGLQLYASGVLIMEHCPDLLPDYFSFVRGVVDSQDLSLNISREMLQQDRQLKLIAGRLEKKIQSELLAMQKDNREDYLKLFNNFGASIKYGLYESYGSNKDMLEDLLVFNSSRGEMVTLAEYVQAMKEDQKYIYYASGDDISRLENLPSAEAVKEKGYEILYMIEQVDEFAIKMLREYGEKEFRSITGGDLALETEDEKKDIQQKREENKDLLNAVKEALGDRVAEVTVSGLLKTYPAGLTTRGEITLEMEKVLSAMPNAGGMPLKAEKVLELNSEHPIFEKLKGLLNSDKEKLSLYADVLYNQALLMEGLQVENPVKFSSAITELML